MDDANIWPESQPAASQLPDTWDLQPPVDGKHMKDPTRDHQNFQAEHSANCEHTESWAINFFILNY